MKSLIERRPIGLNVSVQGGYRPRAIMMEYNSNFELDEAKSILPPADGETLVETHVKLLGNVTKL